MTRRPGNAVSNQILDGRKQKQDDEKARDCCKQSNTGW